MAGIWYRQRSLQSRWWSFYITVFDWPALTTGFRAWTVMTPLHASNLEVPFNHSTGHYISVWTTLLERLEALAAPGCAGETGINRSHLRPGSPSAVKCCPVFRNSPGTTKWPGSSWGHTKCSIWQVLTTPTVGFQVFWTTSMSFNASFSCLLSSTSLLPLSPPSTNTEDFNNYLSLLLPLSTNTKDSNGYSHIRSVVSLLDAHGDAQMLISSSQQSHAIYEGS